MQLRYKALAFSLIGLVLAFSGALLMQTVEAGHGDHNELHACVNPTSGNTRLVGDPEDCSTQEVSMTWNAWIVPTFAIIKAQVVEVGGVPSGERPSADLFVRVDGQHVPLQQNGVKTASEGFDWHTGVYVVTGDDLGGVSPTYSTQGYGVTADANGCTFSFPANFPTSNYELADRPECLVTWNTDMYP